MVVKISQTEILRQSIKLVVFQFSVKESGNGYCINVGIVKIKSRNSCIVANKSRIKACVMCNQQAITGKCKKAFKRFLYLGRVCNHFIGNSRKIYNFLRNRTFGIYKGIEFVDNLTVLYLYRADFGNAAVVNGKTGGLNIENDYFVSKCALVITAETAFFVVYKIGFKAVNNLHALVLRAKHCIGERLNVSVVGYRYRRMSHALGGLDHVLGGGYCVHSGHICVQMKFNAFLRRVVRSLYLFYFLCSVKLDNKIRNGCFL